MNLKPILLKIVLPFALALAGVEYILILKKTESVKVAEYILRLLFLPSLLTTLILKFSESGARRVNKATLISGCVTLSLYLISFIHSLPEHTEDTETFGISILVGIFIAGLLGMSVILTLITLIEHYDQR